MTPAERFEHMVAMAMQAWDETVPYHWRHEASMGRGTGSVMRERYELAVRERLAQSAQVYELEIGASERSR